MQPDVIIIGGGVIGTACAYFLSGRGAKVLVLERSHLGAGASGTTASIVSISGSSGTPESLRPLNVESYHLILDAEKEFDRPLEIIQGGALYVAMNEQEIPEIYTFYEEIHKMGIDCKLLHAIEVRQFEPLLCPDITAALHNPACYHVNPFRLVDGYLGTALRRGGRVEYGVEVRNIKVNNGIIEGVVTNQGEYHTDWVVVACGAHTPMLLSTLGLKIPIVPARGQVILTEACQRLTEHVILFLNHLYIRQTASGNLYLGSHTEFVGFENRITLEKITAFTQAFTRAVPLLSRLRALRFFAGFRPICEDNLPVIGPVPGCPGLIVASGHGRAGVRFSASTGKAVSELIMDGKTEHPINAFSPGRFANNADNNNS
jgi:glycine/D-amino acid oxidase-like deaminating enzyme